MSLADAPLDELLDPSARDEGGRLWRARCLDGSAAATSAAAYEVFCAIAAKAVAAAEAEGGGPAALARVGQLLAASGLGEWFPRVERRARVPNSLTTIVECYMALPPAPAASQGGDGGCPLFRVDPCGLLVSLDAGRGSPFFLHVDHRLALARGGPNSRENLVALQWRANQAKGARVLVLEVQGGLLRGELAPHEYVLADQLPALLDEVDARGLERTFHNVERVLWDLPPWNAAPGAAQKASRRASQRPASRCAGRRCCQPWSDAEVLCLGRLVLQQELEQAITDGRPRINWQRVAEGIAGRDPVQCRDKWKHLARSLQHLGEGELQGDEGKQQQLLQQGCATRRYQRWEEEEVDDAGRLLGALGERFAGAAGERLPPTLRSLPARLEFVCSQVFPGRQLSEVFPGRAPKQVADKCTGLVETALKLALNKILHAGGRNGVTRERWRQLAPRLPLLANELPISVELQQQAMSTEGAAQIRQFIIDPLMNGERSLPPLADYWAEPAGRVAGEGPAAAAGSAGHSTGAAAAAAKPDQSAAAAPQLGMAGQTAGPAPPMVTAGQTLAAAAAAAAPAVEEIDLTLSDSEDEGQAAGSGPESAAGKQQAAATAVAALADMTNAAFVALSLSDSADGGAPAMRKGRQQGQPGAAMRGLAGAQGSQPLQSSSGGGSRCAHTSVQRDSSRGCAPTEQERRQQPLHAGHLQLQGLDRGPGRRVPYTSDQRAAVAAGLQEFGHCHGVYKKIEQKYSGVDGPLRGLNNLQIRNIARKPREAEQLAAAAACRCDDRPAPRMEAASL